MDQGIIWNLKCFYRNDFMINMMNSNVTTCDFQRNFTKKDAICSLASAWNQVRASTLTKAWGKLCPAPNASELKESENTCGLEKILETKRLPTDHAVLKSLNANDVEMWVRQDEERSYRTKKW